VLLTLHHDQPNSEGACRSLLDLNLLERGRVLDSRARRKGLSSLDPSRNPLIRIGMQVSPDGLVTRNGYGVFSLAWRPARQGEWLEQVMQEAGQLRAAIREAHGVPLRFLIWAGGDGSAEDKCVYAAAGLLKRGPRCYVVDSTDPAQLSGALADMRARTNSKLADVLRGLLAIGMAPAQTGCEPLMVLERLEALYRKHRVDPRANFLCLAPAGSSLDELARARGWRRVDLLPDGGSALAGHHSAPLSRGSLYPLALAGVDLREWMAGACLSDDRIFTALRLAAFLHTQSLAGRDKVTLLLPKAWQGVALWTKQDFEMSLGQAGYPGIKIVAGERPRLANYRSMRDPLQDRVFWAVQQRGIPHPEARKITLLRRAGYPVAALSLPPSAPLSSYMQFVHYTVFGLACLRSVNFVTQPGTELYESIAARLYKEALKLGGIEKAKEWGQMLETPRQSQFRNCLTLRYDRLPEPPATPCRHASEVYAALLGQLAGARKVDYGGLAFFGDTRYSPHGRALRKGLARAGDELFRARLKMPVDVGEGPAMNHTCHEMIVGRGRCFLTVLIAEQGDCVPEKAYLRAQYLATQIAMAGKGCPVVSITLKGLTEESLAALAAFFHEAAAALKARRP